jgi:hypothetical protein
MAVTGEAFFNGMVILDLREEIAQCERMGKMHNACMVRYVDLVSKTEIG